jgi:hypothetical protein
VARKLIINTRTHLYHWLARSSRLTDPAFAGSAAFADDGAPELLSDALSQHARRDVGFRLRQAYSATSWAESGFARPSHGAVACFCFRDTLLFVKSAFVAAPNHSANVQSD